MRRGTKFSSWEKMIALGVLMVIAPTSQNVTGHRVLLLRVSLISLQEKLIPRRFYLQEQARRLWESRVH